MKRIRTVRIDQALNGYIVQVGCQTLVCESKGKLIQELDRYLGKPDELEEEYRVKHDGDWKNGLINEEPLRAPIPMGDTCGAEIPTPRSTARR